MGFFLAGMLAGILLGVLLMALYQRRSRPPVVRREPAGPKISLDELIEAPPAERTGELRQNLRRKFMFDEEKVDRAIEFERERQPRARLEDLMQAAIDRWERENK